MGCGESLQHHLPLTIYGKRYYPASPRAALVRNDGEVIGNKKRQREENR
jgi:hypothetical protein